MRALILLATIAVAAAFHGGCGENAHFEECGTACPLTCDNYDNPPKICVLSCNIGCHCDAGYVKTSDGRCVRPEDCPPRAPKHYVCGKNQHFSECASPCPLTCENYANPPKICPAMCVFGCACDKGYVKTKDGQCVRPEECEASQAPIQKTCNEEPETGMCFAYFPSWYYDQKTGKCERFIYGGCGGNGNRYRTEEECLKNCATQAATQKTCVEEPETGMCKAYMPSWYYDQKTGKCERFIYGGCGGNGNRYSTEKECLQNCRGHQQASADACNLPAEPGVCRGFFPRFYFDRATGQCQKFVYGGCGGNENNFESIEECQSTCASSAPSACLEDKKVGPCKARFVRYFFNKDTGKCEEFVYGGCSGNSNNFFSHEDCEAVCLA